jgi:hypothetical protein
MTSLHELNSNSESTLIKLQNSLDQLGDSTEDNASLNDSLAESVALFKDFFTNLSDAEFKPIKFNKGDTPRSKDYNSNLRGMYQDIKKFYTELDNYSIANNKAYNYSQVVISEVRKRASELSSKVLDLRIFNGFVRGDVIVAGDDFTSLDFIDTSAAVSSSSAEILPGGAGLSLARIGSTNLSAQQGVIVDVIPMSPTSSQGAGVNSAPTAGNLERFYEGNYYNFLGDARPEGGSFNLQSVIDPSTLSGAIETEGSTYNNELGATVFLEYGASAEEKALARLDMVDGNPDTFWECEYVSKPEDPLMVDVIEYSITTVEEPGEEDPALSGYRNTEQSETSTATVDINVAELNAIALDRDDVDLTIDLITTLPFEQNVNFVSIDPVVFSQKAFIDVVDIATINESEAAFTTVDNWDQVKFPRTLTPEANEFLTDSQAGAALAPTKFAYAGQGVFPFPLRVAKKIRVTLRMEFPSAQVYEKKYALLKNDVDVVATTTTKTKKGALRSDRRLKKNINLIGKSPSGLNIYSFEYKNAKYGEGLFQGVMSDEIPQDAVIEINGYDAVNYDMLDVEFKQIMSIKLNQGAF